MNAIAFFDFDGTITNNDSLPDFIRYCFGKPSYCFGIFLLSPALFIYQLKIISRSELKEKVISYFFKDWDVIRFQKYADQYSSNQIDNNTRSKAIEKILWHKQQGHEVVIVSASIENWIIKWCEKYKIELIATKIEIRKQKITGKLASKNCYGIEKVKRIKNVYDLSKYDCIFAYGNSSGDKEMLDLADEKFYRIF